MLPCWYFIMAKSFAVRACVRVAVDRGQGFEPTSLWERIPFSMKYYDCFNGGFHRFYFMSIVWNFSVHTHKTGFFVDLICLAIVQFSNAYKISLFRGMSH